MGFLQNTRRPEGLGGRLMVSMMNRGTHAALSEWGLSHLNTEIPPRAFLRWDAAEVPISDG